MPNSRSPVESKWSEASLIGIYALLMQKLDKEYGVDEGDIE